MGCWSARDDRFVLTIETWYEHADFILMLYAGTVAISILLTDKAHSTSSRVLAVEAVPMCKVAYVT